MHTCEVCFLHSTSAHASKRGLPVSRSLQTMVGAWCTVLQVNAALDELVAHAAACYKQMLLVSRNQLGRVAAEERQRLHDLYHSVEVSVHGFGTLRVEEQGEGGNACGGLGRKEGEGVGVPLKHCGSGSAGATSDIVRRRLDILCSPCVYLCRGSANFETRNVCIFWVSWARTGRQRLRIEGQLGLKGGALLHSFHCLCAAVCLAEGSA
jgi:hypothetical protein